MNKMKVYLVCTGVGIINRGIETFARECFDGLKNIEGLDISLFKGAGEEKEKEKILWNIPRNGELAPLLGKFIKRNGYVVEQLSSFLPFVKAIRQGNPDLIFYSDSNLGFQLYRWRQQIGVPYKLLFSNGGPCSPPFDRTDFVHQVSPLYRQQALQAEESPDKHILVPYGINIPQDDLFLNPEEIQNLRQKLGLPLDRKIVISVGAIDPNSHKRMDYVINEIATIPEPRPYLVLLGHIPPEGQSIIEQAHCQLGLDNFTARSVSYQEVNQYYQVADIFTLASLSEGFGRVFLEALMHGLPCIVHNHPVMRYVLGSYGTFIDLSIQGNLSDGLSRLLKNHSNSHEQKIKRRKYVENTFSWATLAPKYLKMFHHCLNVPALSENPSKS
jgi:glycosyltransferase involved in cell wall biosynthesis